LNRHGDDLIFFLIIFKMKHHFFWFLLFLGLILDSHLVAANPDLPLNDSLSVSLRIALQFSTVDLGEKPKKKRFLRGDHMVEVGNDTKSPTIALEILLGLIRIWD